VTLWFLIHGCDTVNGGAVELSWKLRPASSASEDKFVDCDSGKEFTREVRDMVLHWRVNGEEDKKSWRCDFNHGVTGFDLSEGTAQLWVTPACEDRDADVATYIAPAIVERTVVRGQTVSLGAVEVVVAVSDCRNPDGAAQDDKRPCICCATGDVCTPPSK
jgi:hypothetical protein